MSEIRKNVGTQIIVRANSEYVTWRELTQYVWELVQFSTYAHRVESMLKITKDAVHEWR